MDPLKTLLRLWQDCRASAAVEIALVTPLLMVIMFSCFEMGNYFYNEHIVDKAVRDGARYAARRSYIDYAGCAPASTMVDAVRNVTRTGQLASGGTPLLGNWTDATTITVTVACTSLNTGIYYGLAMGAPVVTVTATVPYTSLLGTLGLNTLGFTLNATSQAAVMGT